MWPAPYYPRACYAWIDRSGLPARGFNDMWFGGSFILHFAPRRKVFIDGRSFYSDEFFTRSYASIQDAEPGWEAEVDRLGIQWFLLRPDGFPQLHESLEASGRWERVYLDSQCAVYAGRRRAPAVPAPSP